MKTLTQIRLEEQWDDLTDKEKAAAIRRLRDSMGKDAFCDWVIHTFGADTIKKALIRMGHIKEH